MSWPPGKSCEEVRVPLPKPGDKSAYVKFIERGAWDFAVVSAAVWASVSGRSVRDIRIVCGGVAPVPWALDHGRKSFERKPGFTGIRVPSSP